VTPVERLLDLPGPLPEGERVLWQGRPSVRQIALRVFHVRLIVVYFAGLAIWRLTAVNGGATEWLGALGLAALLAGAALALLALLAVLTARASAYAITNRRVILRIGVALPITLQLPFRALEGAALRPYGDGSGDIVLQLAGGSPLGYAVLWPHVRPWHVRDPQPMLRAVPDCRTVAKLLADAVGATENDIETSRLPAETTAPPQPLAARLRRASA
jgi:hypothetical protein